MNCKIHPTKEALGKCNECGDLVCCDCAVFVRSLLCRKCAAVMLFPDERREEKKSVSA